MRPASCAARRSCPCGPQTQLHPTASYQYVGSESSEKRILTPLTSIVSTIIFTSTVLMISSCGFPNRESLFRDCNLHWECGRPRAIQNLRASGSWPNFQSDYTARAREARKTCQEEAERRPNLWRVAHPNDRLGMRPKRSVPSFLLIFVVTFFDSCLIVELTIC